MKRSEIPAYDMNEAGPEHLRLTGILVMRFMASVHNDPRRLLPHVHEFFQMYLLQGEARVMLDFEEYDVSGTTAVFVCPGQVHTVRIGPDMDGVTVSFTRDFFDDQSSAARQLPAFPFFFPERALPCIPLSGNNAGEITGLFDSLRHEFDQGLPDAADVLHPCLHLLLAKLRRLYVEAAPTARTNRALQLTREFQLLLEAEFKKPYPIEHYAKHLEVTANHLNDVVRAQLGHAAGDLIRRRRLLHAKRLLLHSEQSVAEIGYELGFDDPSYFSKFFRRYEGMTPSQFRPHIREKYEESHG